MRNQVLQLTGPGDPSSEWSPPVELQYKGCCLLDVAGRRRALCSTNPSSSAEASPNHTIPGVTSHSLHPHPRPQQYIAERFDPRQYLFKRLLLSGRNLWNPGPPVLSSLRVLQWNAHSLTREKQVILSQVLQHHEIDIFLMQEIGATKINIPGYTIFDSPRGSLGGGTCIGIRTHPSLKHQRIECRISESYSNEVEVTQVALHSGPHTCYLTSAYFPTGVHSPASLAFLTAKIPPNSAHLICGDFNCHDDAWDSHVAPDEGGSCLLDWASLHSLDIANDAILPTRSATHSSGSSRTLRTIRSSPDITLSKDCHIADWQTSMAIESDHHRIFFNVSIANLPSDTRHLKNAPGRTHISFKKADWTSFADKIERTITRHQLGKSRDPQALNNDLLRGLKTASAQLPQGRLPTASAVCSREADDLLHEALQAKIALEVADDGAPACLLKDFYEKRNKAIEKIRTDRTDAWKKKCSKLNPAERSDWNMFKPKSSKPNATLCHEGKLYTTDRAQANVLAAHFKRISTRSVNAAKPPSTRELLKKMPVQPSLPGTSVNEFSMFELDAGLRDLHTGKAAGVDEVYAEYLLHLGPQGKHLLLKVCSCSLRTGIIPSRWLQGLVVALQKAGKDPSLLGNLRPITLTSVIGKLCERLVANRLIPYLHFTDNQFGFQRQRTVSDVAAFLFHRMSKAFHHRTFQPQLRPHETSDRLVTVFVDLCKAFDKVDHCLLLKKLSRLGIPHPLVRWISNFLRGRTFKVRVGNELSRTKGINRGVPQGTVLGPILFTIYINDLSEQLNSVPDLEHAFFADDLTLMAQGSLVQDTQRTLQRALDVVHRWCNDNFMEVNLEKTEAFVFKHGTRGLATCEIDQLRLCYGTHQLSLNDNSTERLLGLHVDHHGFMVQHHKKTLQTVQRRLGLLRTAMNSVYGPCANDRRTFFIALCESVLLFGAEVIMPNQSDTFINRKVGPAFLAGARMVTGLSSCTDSDDVLLESRLDPIANVALARSVKLLETYERCDGIRHDMLLPPAPLDVVLLPHFLAPAKQLREEVCRDRNIPVTHPREPLLRLRRIAAADMSFMSKIKIYPQAVTPIAPNITCDIEKRTAKRKANSETLLTRFQEARPTYQIWTDGSVVQQTPTTPHCSGAAAHIFATHDAANLTEILAPAGRLACSYRAETVGILSGLKSLLSQLKTLSKTNFLARAQIRKASPTIAPELRRRVTKTLLRMHRDRQHRVILFSDSQSLLSSLATGPLHTEHDLEDQIWFTLQQLSQYATVTLQFVYAHAGLRRNEAVDKSAKKALEHPDQDITPIWITDFVTATRSFLRKRWIASLEPSDRRSIFRGFMNTDTMNLPRALAQLRVNESLLAGRLCHRLQTSRLQSCRWCCPEEHAALEPRHPSAPQRSSYQPWSEPRQCPLCDHVGSHTGNLLRHLVHSHAKSNEEARAALGFRPKKQDVQRLAPADNRCDFCPLSSPRAFPTRNGLAQHIRLCHPEEFTQKPRIEFAPRGTGPIESPLHLFLHCSAPAVVTLRRDVFKTIPRQETKAKKLFLDHRTIEFFEKLQHLLPG